MVLVAKRDLLLEEGVARFPIAGALARVQPARQSSGIHGADGTSPAKTPGCVPGGT
jgi:hypothetical protein